MPRKSHAAIALIVMLAPALLVASVAVATTPTTAPSLPPATNPSEKDLIKRGLLKVSQKQRLKITHTTTVTIPQTQTFQFFHAMPDKMPWSIQSAEHGWEKLTTSPSVPEIHVDDKTNGLCFKWELNSPSPGQVKFVTSYEVMTAAREFSPGSVKLNWSDFAVPRLDRSDAEIAAANDEMIKLVDAARKKPSPMQAVVDFTKWISQKITYDASVGYDPRDIKSTLQNGRGHCGHRFEVFKLLCEMAGIECRIALGYINSNQTGLWNGHDDWHRHTWAEINVPGAGWVEVEPGIEHKGKSPFYIPATYILTRGLESYRVKSDENENWGNAGANLDTIEFKTLK